MWQVEARVGIHGLVIGLTGRIQLLVVAVNNAGLIVNAGYRTWVFWV